MNQKYLDKLQEKKEIDGVYLANSLQQGFIYHALNQGDEDDAYNVQLVFDYNTTLDADKYKKSWEYALKRYASLRLRFAWDEEIIQIIDKEVDLDWRYIEIIGVSDKEKDYKLKEIQQEDRKERYKLDKGKLLRIYLIKQSEDLYTCIVSNHHAILDGWSGTILMDYIHDTYFDLFNEKHPSVYSDELYEISQKFIQKNNVEHIEYWNNQLSELDSRLDLKSLLKETVVSRNLPEYKNIISPSFHDLKIAGDLYNSLKRLTEREGFTISAVLQFAWHKMLSIYGNTDRTIVGTTVSGRNLPIDNIENVFLGKVKRSYK